jgi:hypothetical protein
MGGRGAASPGGSGVRVVAGPDGQPLPYNVTSFDDGLGGAIYPFLEQSGRAWHLVTRPAAEVLGTWGANTAAGANIGNASILTNANTGDANAGAGGVAGNETDEAGSGAVHPAHTFGQSQPTLRWVNGSQVSDLYVAGMDTEEFLAATGLELDMHKGGFVLSKRISRIMRPHFVSGFFKESDVAIGYMAQTPDEAKVWDGAGLISRRLLRKLAAQQAEGLMGAEKLPPAKREKLARELARAQRVEFTIMTPKGQDKGHALVADDLRDENGRPVDFLLPQDTKREVRLVQPWAAVGGQAGGGEGQSEMTNPDEMATFVGLSFVHGHNEMRLDIQSLINLHPFFREEQLLDWLRDEGDLFEQAVVTGQVAEVMGRIDPQASLPDLQGWPLREYLASGGQPMWFRSHVKSLFNQHLKRLNHSTLDKMRLPIPGGRHYVMPVGVGQRAGMGQADGQPLHVPRGHIQIDAGRGTAWVNDEDWLTLPDSPNLVPSSAEGGEGIAGILGGADNDDALWLHPFTDHDGERKVLAWRSPNQVGEYVVLKPTEQSHDLPWATAGGEAISYPAADSRVLPLRIDQTETDYLGLVDPETSGGLGEGEAYGVEVMEQAVSRAVANQGALGMYCNSLMLNKALYGRLPAYPPAPLEDIIDSAVKTGADLSQVVAWNYDSSREILESRIPIPYLLHKRLSVDWSDKENRPPSPRQSSVAPGNAHWLDRLEAGVQAHIADMKERRDGLAAQARPPEAMIQAALADPEMVALGAGLNQRFAAILNSKDKGQYQSVLERARLGVVDYLSYFPPAQRQRILLGALGSVYGGDEAGQGRTAVGSDIATWLDAFDEGSLPQQGWRPWLTGLSPARETMVALRQVGVLAEVIETKEGLVVWPAGLDAEGMGRLDEETT